MSTTLRRTTAALATTALVGGPIAVMTASPASADQEKTKEFRVGGADVDFEVEKDDGRFEVSVEIDDAKPGSRFRIILKHDGKRFFRDVRRADDDGDIEVDRTRRDTRGRDTFRVKVKKIGGGSKSRVIRMR